MTVSSRHGGGLTLMRVLGRELEQFASFIRPIPYPIEGFENIPQVESRELKLWEEAGCFSGKPMPRRFTRPYFSNQVKRLFRLPNPEYIDLDFYRRHYTAYLKENADVRKGKFLVVPQNLHAVIIANELRRKFGIAYATWIMDDHLVQYDRESDAFRYPYPKGFEAEFRYHLQHAHHVFVISPAMGEFYKNRFGIEYSVLFSPADPPEKTFEPKYSGNGSLRLCHFGRVWKWPLDAVEKFAVQLNTLDATLDIYSHFPVEGILSENPRVILKKPVDASEVPRRMKEYDAVTIFYGMIDEVRHWSTFNISTKMSECLASGLPVLFVGPGYGAMTKWAMDNDCGLVITDPENENQLQRVRRLRDAAYAKGISERCLQVSLELTCTEAMQRVWQKGWDKVLNA